MCSVSIDWLPNTLHPLYIIIFIGGMKLKDHNRIEAVFFSDPVDTKEHGLGEFDVYMYNISCHMRRCRGNGLKREERESILN